METCLEEVALAACSPSQPDAKAAPFPSVTKVGGLSPILIFLSQQPPSCRRSCPSFLLVRFGIMNLHTRTRKVGRETSGLKFTPRDLGLSAVWHKATHVHATKASKRTYARTYTAWHTHARVAGKSQVQVARHGTSSILPNRANVKLSKVVHTQHTDTLNFAHTHPVGNHTWRSSHPPLRYPSEAHTLQLLSSGQQEDVVCKT